VVVGGSNHFRKPFFFPYSFSNPKVHGKIPWFQMIITDFSKKNSQTSSCRFTFRHFHQPPHVPRPPRAAVLWLSLEDRGGARWWVIASLWPRRSRPGQSMEVPDDPYGENASAETEWPCCVFVQRVEKCGPRKKWIWAVGPVAGYLDDSILRI
jgi:hypothetical protein